MKKRKEQEVSLLETSGVNLAVNTIEKREKRLGLIAS